MTSHEARSILERYRPGLSIDSDDLELKSAMDLVQVDPLLKQWFDRHCQFQLGVRKELSSLRAPEALKSRLKQRQLRTTQPKPIWQSPAWLAAAAGIVFCLILASQWIGAERIPDTFADYRTRMVSTVLRRYRMDVRSSDMKAVREFMVSQGAPHDYEVPQGLSQISLAGGGFLRWRDNPVAMVCFGKPGGSMSYLFVMDRTALKDAPPVVPQFSTVHGRSCASWSSANRVYFLTAAEGLEAKVLL